MEAVLGSLKSQIRAFLRGLGLLKDKRKNLSKDNLLCHSYFYPLEDLVQDKRKFEEIVKEEEKEEVLEEEV